MTPGALASIIISALIFIILIACVIRLCYKYVFVLSF